MLPKNTTPKVMALCCAAGLLITSDLSAQTAEDGLPAELRTDLLDQNLDRLRQDTAPPTTEGLGKTSLETLKGQTVSFDDVFADPDNIALNFAYAQQLIADLDYHEAAKTLERILALDSSQEKARALLAVLLYRMQRYDDAKDVLSQLNEVPLSPDDKAAMSDLRQKLQQSDERLSFHALFGLGTDIQSNRNQASFGRRSISQGQILRRGAGANMDIGLLAVQRFDMTYELDKTYGHELFASLNSFQNAQSEEHDADAIYVRLDAGGLYRTLYGDLRLSGYGSQLYLNGRDYRTQYGGQLGYEYRFTPQLRVSLTEDLSWSNFYDHKTGSLTTEQSNSNSRRDGWTNDVEARILWQPRDWVLLQHFQGYQTHFAERRSIFGTNDVSGGYDQWSTGVRADFFWNGIIPSIATNYSYRAYDETDPLIQTPGLTRRDHVFTVDVGVSVPFLDLTFGSDLPAFLHDIRANAQIGYRFQGSNNPAAASENISGSLMITKEFEF